MAAVRLQASAPHEPIRSLRYTDDTFVRTEAGWRIKERAFFLWGQAPHAQA